MNRSGPKMRFLHLHSNFDRGEAALRCVRLINAFGPKIGHVIVSAEEDALEAADAISGKIAADCEVGFPRLGGFPSLGRLKKLAEAMRGYDLVLTYGWGAMDGAMAHTLFSQLYSLPPLIHHENGFEADELDGLKPRRNWYRRIALGRSAGLVVTSKGLERVAVETWSQPRARVLRISPGVDLSRFAKKAKADVLPGLIKRKGEKWVGTVGELTPEKNLPMMVQAFADLPEHWQLVILGKGPERASVLRKAEELGAEHRVHIPFFAGDPAKVMGLFDVFAISAQVEQFPATVAEAMAAGLPIAGFAAGDIAEMVARENRPFICEPRTPEALSRSLFRFADDSDLRKACGKANLAKAQKHFDERKMIALHKALYASAMGLDTPL